MSDDRMQAAREARFCEAIRAKTADNVLLETLRGAPSVEAWTHYPPGDVYDRDSGAQWYYHCHSPATDAREHGHFHCFVRPSGDKGPVHHLVAVGVDPYGKLIRLFTVNHWVVGDDWLDAEGTLPLLERFDAELARPSYLVNRWLTAILRLYHSEIAELIRKRDATLAGHAAPPETEVREDRGLEVTSELEVDLMATARQLGI